MPKAKKKQNNDAKILFAVIAILFILIAGMMLLAVFIAVGLVVVPVALYYWVGGLATQQPTIESPAITVQALECSTYGDSDSMRIMVQNNHLDLVARPVGEQRLEAVDQNPRQGMEAEDGEKSQGYCGKQPAQGKGHRLSAAPWWSRFPAKGPYCARYPRRAPLLVWQRSGCVR